FVSTLEAFSSISYYVPGSVRARVFGVHILPWPMEPLATPFTAPDAKLVRIDLRRVVLEPLCGRYGRCVRKTQILHVDSQFLRHKRGSREPLGKRNGTEAF